ncbi:MAG: ribosome biogenesis GTP-binding protein YihA/YsxC [Bryobacterales bacterium]|nr:ribosome biogenesis GTP-binding protein YihA/YsxC [Bryobacterales bacterium]
MQVEFLISATSAAQFPAEPKPEIAFLGRSNVGKSSLLNRLAGNQKVAFTSSRPGCTQQINFFDLDGKSRLVDLPGYGYAKAPEAIRRSWAGFINEYLQHRECLRLCICLLDMRRGWMDSDRQLREWLEFNHRDFLVVATKADKMRGVGQVKQQVEKIRSEVPKREVIAVSAQTGQGVKELWQAIWKIRTSQ